MSIKTGIDRIVISVFTLVATTVAIIGNSAASERQISGVIINEVCTSNISNCKDAYGNYPDWVEVYNTTGSNISLSGYALVSSSDSEKDRYIFPSGVVLKPGEYHIFSPGFNMSSKGCALTLIDDRSGILDRVNVPALEHDTTYARSEDGTGEWVIKHPSPGYQNSEEITLDPVATGTVEASVPSGFYEKEFRLNLLSSETGRKIYYTLDGSDPADNGVIYEEPIRIYDRTENDNVFSVIPEVSQETMSDKNLLPSYKVDKCTVVRAVAKDGNGHFTSESVFTYFVGFDKKSSYDNMAVISVTADPDDLFSHDNGIMVLGDKFDTYEEAGMPEEYDDDKANFCERGRRSERDIVLDIFDEQHVRTLETPARIRIKGLSSRWDVQKSFNILFYKGISGENRKSFELGGNRFNLHSFALDKCGQDYDTKMRDTIMERCMQNSSCTTNRRIPCCLFLNGEYWGFYWLAERFDRSFIADTYNINKENVVIAETTEFEEYDDWQFDLDRNAVVDYFAGNIIAAHEGDWPASNFAIWKDTSNDNSAYRGGRYIPIILDMNSDSMKDPELNSFEYLSERFYPFARLMENDTDFRNDLLLRIDSMNNKEFEKNTVLTLIDDISSDIRDQMILDKMRYSNCSREEALQSFDEGVEELKSFYEQRREYLKAYTPLF